MRRRVPGRRAPSAAPRVRPARGRALRRNENRPKDALDAEKGRPAAAALEILDISRPIGEGTRGWPGEIAFSFRTTASLADGSPYESTCFTMSAHLGTHADAPAHVLPEGAAIGAVSLHPFIGPARVVLLPGSGEVGPDSLPHRAIGVPRVLFRTEGKAFLSPLAAVRLAEKGTVLVGTDALSIDPEDAEDLPVHRTLLSRRVALLENLRLEHVEPGDYGLVAAPLAFESLDASPVRAVLIRTVAEKKKPRPAR
ncbi:MAG: cyclase family protein [Thermoanaerobaculia bacterium]